MYSADSFFTLDGPERIGLALLSLALFALVVWGTTKSAARLNGVIARLCLSLFAFYLFVWLSPQVYYTYYRLIIPGLPAQWVVGTPPHSLDVLKLLTFTGPSNLSAHGQALLGWAALLVPQLSSDRRPMTKG